MTHAEIDNLDGDALRVAVAESLGYKWFADRSYYPAGAYFSEWMRKLYCPREFPEVDNYEMRVAEGTEPIRADNLFGKPYWPSDLNAAMRDLVEPMKDKHGFNLRWWAIQWECYSVVQGCVCKGLHPTHAASAVCRWFLKLKAGDA